MAVNVRCDNCGRLVKMNLEPDGSTKTRCPGCKSRMTVPEGSASLPTPKIPGAAMASASAGGGAPTAGQTGGRPAAPPTGKPGDPKDKEKGKEAEEEGPPAKLSPAMAVLAAAMPWLLSICLHAGGAADPAVRRGGGSGRRHGSSASAGGGPQRKVQPGASHRRTDAGDTRQEVDVSDSASTSERRNDPAGRGEQGLGQRGQRQQGDRQGMGLSDKSGEITAYGFGGGGGGGAGGTADFGLARRRDGKVAFYGSGGGGNASYVIYVIDHSGSVVGSFDEIRMQLKDSIRRLVARQQFHVVFFSHDKYEEIQPKRLVFARKTTAQGAEGPGRHPGHGVRLQPDPGPGSGLPRLRNTPDKRGKLCYILTDGEFDSSGYQYKGPGGKVLMGNEAVNAWLRANNKDRSVHMYPIILGPPPGADTETSMKQMATENGGGCFAGCTG